eukprot:CAMPEP_0177786384 /NCGR_PEP_ID=MMETSP0491_2-20121128/20890_1 /TAXON_ID=63592 /ORGANISM="Tetraselmis chuii, Strain PLY429" /LENGTH=133 /DNA_ID=CAMNT_0019307583 /DNA_START=291 /DNA_END=689 /DNA_ORIENTATION=+
MPAAGSSDGALRGGYSSAAYQHGVWRGNRDSEVDSTTGGRPSSTPLGASRAIVGRVIQPSSSQQQQQQQRQRRSGVTRSTSIGTPSRATNSGWASPRRGSTRSSSAQSPPRYHPTHPYNHASSGNSYPHPTLR